ncbi:DUF502 domain-containing protein [Halosolutus gelatinilyticus]|uniref:DUF502 domain-containing protein n=1 Tax=Halosolutus gelatinilyticus TaxID=2931975 RepID=UPI001FF18426|nr:DUF502 domain-containing protein [Halosolutus gelatinilyticus]
MSRSTSALKRWLGNGVAITIPLAVTLLLLSVVVNFVLSALSPVVLAAIYLWPNEPSTVVVQATTLLSLLGLVLLVGFVADHTSGTRVSRTVHETAESIPGVSTIYASVRQASDVLVDDDTDQFKDVKLVEFPHENAHMLGFLTSETPPVIEDCVGERDMRTIMIPLGPNPTTNGFVVHVSDEHVRDVDMSIEAAARSIATLGVVTETNGDSAATEGTDGSDRSTVVDRPSVDAD